MNRISRILNFSGRTTSRHFCHHRDVSSSVSSNFPVAKKSTALDKHYEKAVKAYDSPDLFFRDPSYESWIMGKLQNHFNFSSKKRYGTPNINLFVDLGCGNGRFTNSFVDLLARASVDVSCIGVDPSSELLNVAVQQPRITQTICMNAAKFSSLEISYSNLLMKEMVHHLPDSDMITVFRGLHRQLQTLGNVVIITRPVETEYPFFERIKQIWRTTQPPHDHVVTAMEAAGFDVHVDVGTFPVLVSKAAWLSFIRNKTWSEFSMCSNEEMDNGLQDLEATFRDFSELKFDETVIFVVGKKCDL